jgi:hypothetical protein
VLGSNTLNLVVAVASIIEYLDFRVRRLDIEGDYTVPLHIS